METMDDLREAVETRDGVLTLLLEQVRDAYGAGRLGVHVRTAISKKLQGLGLGHYPDPLPTYQEEEVRLYTLGSGIADIIGAVLGPSREHDEEIRSAVGGEAAEVLEKVRELVCE
ncbi:MAG: hypothetical protein IH865_11005 [Chloroflexi bacterium]|nr:hypothetical protein [Chloroflexota bacterium]